MDRIREKERWITFGSREALAGATVAEGGRWPSEGGPAQARRVIVMARKRIRVCL